MSLFFLQFHKWQIKSVGFTHYHHITSWKCKKYFFLIWFHTWKVQKKSLSGLLHQTQRIKQNVQVWDLNTSVSISLKSNLCFPWIIIMIWCLEFDSSVKSRMFPEHPILPKSPPVISLILSLWYLILIKKGKKSFSIEFFNKFDTMLH